MASIISVDTLQDSAGSNEITTANVKTAFDDRVKAWVNLDGTGTATLRESLNITSVTDDGTGRYDFAITNAMSNTNYAINASGRQNESPAFSGMAFGIDTESASLAHVSCRNTSGSLTDQEILCCSLFGDLA